jgi:hypothetical protein
MAKAEQKIQISFVMKDPEGTAALRVVSGHAHRVGQAWIDLGFAFEQMADSLDRLVSGPEDETEDPS